MGDKALSMRRAIVIKKLGHLSTSLCTDARGKKPTMAGVAALKLNTDRLFVTMQLYPMRLG